MTTEPPDVRQFVLLADESAHWKIAGLSQLERVLLALNEFAASTDSASDIQVVIFWKPDIPSTLRRPFAGAHLSRMTSTESVKLAQPGATVLSTRLFIDRNGMAGLLAEGQFSSVEKEIADSLEWWSELSRNLAVSWQKNAQGSHYLNGLADVPVCEREFLRGAGKSQDGLVSRFLNRPISRTVTRFLLKFPISPTGWTVAIFVLPVAAFFLLLRGDYAGVLAGTAIFQLYSILDGCDGEIARAKYLESARGGRIDDFLDMVGSVFFVTGLGLGLSRWLGVFYRWEGMVCAAVILLNEMFLRFSQSRSASGSSAQPIRQLTDDVPASSGSLTPALYPRHREMIQNSGLLALGEKKAWWIIQFTKRDVAVFAFLLLALANLGPWILHLWITVSTVTLALTTKARMRPPRSSSRDASAE